MKFSVFLKIATVIMFKISYRHRSTFLSILQQSHESRQRCAKRAENFLHTATHYRAVSLIVSLKFKQSSTDNDKSLILGKCFLNTALSAAGLFLHCFKFSGHNYICIVLCLCYIYVMPSYFPSGLSLFTRRPRSRKLLASNPLAQVHIILWALYRSAGKIIDHQLCCGLRWKLLSRS